VPPHWNEDMVEDEGSRWAGQCLSFDSLAARGCPARSIAGQYIHDRKSPAAYYDDEVQDDIEREADAALRAEYHAEL
jgi:hypothetical protein